MFFKIVNFIASAFIFRPIVLIFTFGSFGFKTISYSRDLELGVVGWCKGDE